MASVEILITIYTHGTLFLNNYIFFIYSEKQVGRGRAARIKIHERPTFNWVGIVKEIHRNSENEQALIKLWWCENGTFISQEAGYYIRRTVGEWCTIKRPMRELWRWMFRLETRSWRRGRRIPILVRFRRNFRGNRERTAGKPRRR